LVVIFADFLALASLEAQRSLLPRRGPHGSTRGGSPWFFGLTGSMRDPNTQGRGGKEREISKWQRTSPWYSGYPFSLPVRRKTGLIPAGSWAWQRQLPRSSMPCHRYRSSAAPVPPLHLVQAEQASPLSCRRGRRVCYRLFSKKLSQLRNVNNKSVIIDNRFHGNLL